MKCEWLLLRWKGQDLMSFSGVLKVKNDKKGLIAKIAYAIMNKR